MGQAIECKVIELNRSRNNVVLSRRAVLEEQRKEDRERILDRLQPGQVVEGTISNIVDFGAFVDLDGIDGLIHISELSWSHVNHPSEILTIGDTVSVKVLDIDRQRQRISLGPEADPGGSLAARGRHLQHRRRARGQRHQGGHLRRVRRDPRRRRGARAHLRARPAPRREPARDHPARRPGAGQDPRDRLGAPPAVAVDQARRGPGPAGAPDRTARRPTRVAAKPGTSTTCPSSACPRTCSRASPRRPAEATEPEADRRSPSRAAEARGRATRRRSRRGGCPRRARARGEPTDAAAAAEAASARAATRPPGRGRPCGGDAPRGPREPPTARGRSRLTPRPAVVPFIGLTGGIGAGKSTALEALERLGAAVVSTDGVVHELYETAEVKRAVVERFGVDVAPDGAVDRPPLAERAFATPSTGRGSRACCGRVWRSGWSPGGGARARADPSPRAAVVEVPLLFEAGMEMRSTPRSRSSPRRICAPQRASSAGPRRARRALRAPAHAGAKGGARGLCRRQRRDRSASCESKLSAILDKLQTG